jgi:N-acetylmuramoyl-L-alanine amidase
MQPSKRLRLGLIDGSAGAARALAVPIVLAFLAACGTDASSLAPTAPPSTAAIALPSAVQSADTVTPEPAPGSASTVYAPNPGAIVVAIDAGHGGCLDWGVPDPSERGEAYAEETMTLAIAQRLRDLLAADGIGVVMIRDADEALAGDFAPDFGCDGPPFRDVDGDGNAGFEETGRFRTRDELQARIDRGNLAAADAFVSIHVNSPTEGGQVIEIAFGQTFYDDETPWGEESARLADAVQRGAVEAIDPLTTYTRQDRGTEAIAYYAISRAWQDGDACEREGDTHCKPQRGLLMPSALAEVGSITLRAEHDLLVSADGQAAVAEGLFDGLAAYFDGRELAGRIALADAAIDATPRAIDGDGPPFWPAVVADGEVELRLTNTGTAAWPEGAVLVAGWERTDEPYLARAPDGLVPLDVEIPALAPGESVLVSVELPPRPGSERAVAWISLMDGSATLADRGSPALQLATRALP